MTVRGAERERNDWQKLVRYARQDGPGQWFREFIHDLQFEDAALLDAVSYLANVYENCVDRQDDDHDEWCRRCGAYLWLLERTSESGAPRDACLAAYRRREMVLRPKDADL